MGDSALRALRSSDCAPSTEGCHEDGDHRPSCDDLFCAGLHVRLLRRELVVAVHHRRFALRSLSEPVSWVGRSARRSGDKSRRTAGAFHRELIAPPVCDRQASAPLEQTAPPQGNSSCPSSRRRPAPLHLSMGATITKFTDVSMCNASGSQKCPSCRFMLSFLTAGSTCSARGDEATSVREHCHLSSLHQALHREQAVAPSRLRTRSQRWHHRLWRTKPSWLMCSTRSPPPTTGNLTDTGLLTLWRVLDWAS